MRSADHLHQHFVIGCIDVQHIHARGRDHDVTGGVIGHANHAFEHDAGFRANDLVVFGFRQGFDEFILGIESRMNEFDNFLQESALVFALGMARRMRV